jgi:HEAT repeat protein
MVPKLVVLGMSMLVLMASSLCRRFAGSGATLLIVLAGLVSEVGAAPTAPQIRAAVAKLAAAGGLSWNPMERNPAEEAVYTLQQAPRTELLGLLRHPSALVRATAARLLAATPDPGPIYVALGDNAEVRHGCFDTVDVTSVGSYVLDGLCSERDKPVHQELLLRAARDAALPADVRREALVCVAPWRPDEATPLALAWLKDAKGGDLAAGIEVLGEARAVHHASQILAYAKNPDDSVRYEVAQALGMLQTPEAARGLAGMIDDPDPSVRFRSGVAYLRQPVHDRALVRRVLQRGGISDYELTEALIEGERPFALAELHDYLESLEPALASGKLDYPSIRSKLVATTGGRNFVHQLTPIRVPRWLLLETAAAESLATARGYLRSVNRDERLVGARAVCAARDRESIPRLQLLVDDREPDVRIAAAEALVQLDAKGSLPAIRRAALRARPEDILRFRKAVDALQQRGSVQ